MKCMSVKAYLDQSTRTARKLFCPLGTTNEVPKKAAAPGTEKDESL